MNKYILNYRKYEKKTLAEWLYLRGDSVSSSEGTTAVLTRAA